MNEHLFLGDSTYPHTKSAWQIRRELIKEKFYQFFDFPTEDKSQVTSVSCKLFVDYVLQESADRIEQLERKLAEAQEDAERYRFIRNISDGVIGLAGVPCVAMPNGMSSGYYLNAEHADFAIDAAIKEGKA